MSSTITPILTAAILISLSAVLTPPATTAEVAAEPDSVRFVSFNVWELSRTKLDEVDAAGKGTNAQLRAAAEIVQRLRPDVMLLNEIDYDEAGENAQLFIDRYLAVSQAGLEPISFSHIVFEPSNTGEPSGLDLDNNGDTDDPEDAWGFGRYPGQYAMALYSRFPVAETRAVRTFRLLKWSSMLGNLIPDGTPGKPAWYNAREVAVLRLSSKSHWDVPLEIDGRVVHVLASHPTPPSFDGPEDRNGRRNHDEIRLWVNYLSADDRAAWIVDDEGRHGGLDANEPFVLMGDLNADPYADGPGGHPAIAQLLKHPRIQDPQPASAGGSYMRKRPYEGDKARLTSDWGRIDYVLPSTDVDVIGSGVFWPPPHDPLYPLVEGEGRASDHRAVWVDIAF